jgi:hypothetical protein
MKRKATEFANINDLSELNRWMNGYLNKLSLGNYFLNIQNELSSKLGEKNTYNLKKYKVCNNQKLGIGMEIHIFSII